MYFNGTGIWGGETLWAPYLMNLWLDCVQISYDCSLGISDDLINFWDESIKNKMLVGTITYEPLLGLHSNFQPFKKLTWW